VRRRSFGRGESGCHGDLLGSSNQQFNTRQSIEFHINIGADRAHLMAISFPFLTEVDPLGSSEGTLLGLVDRVHTRSMFLKVFRHPKRKVTTSLAHVVRDVAIRKCNGPQVNPLRARHWCRKN